MPDNPKYSIRESGAFTEIFDLQMSKSGPLSGLTFAVKDNIDIAGYKTGYGNPTWAKTHPVAVSHAICVEQLLNAGAKCTGKTVTDELAFSLEGENFFFGTPLNPKAPLRVPGGSSSGSASAVACGIVDFALGTDTGGSVRVPANNCGVFGLRPSHGMISLAGVRYFAPTFDTVGVFAASADVLSKVSSILLSCQPIHREVGTIYLLDEVMPLLDKDVATFFEIAQSLIIEQHFPGKLRKISLREIVQAHEEGMESWIETFTPIQWSEIWSTLGSWIEEVKPAFGSKTKENFDLVKEFDHSKVSAAIIRREHYFRCLKSLLKPNDLICMPTTHITAPVKGTLVGDRSEDRYYHRTISLTSISGIGRLPEVSLPLGTIKNVPHGLSLLAAHGEDGFLLYVAEKLSCSKNIVV